jgi:hypothetical protein
MDSRYLSLWQKHKDEHLIPMYQISKVALPATGAKFRIHMFLIGYFKSSQVTITNT